MYSCSECPASKPDYLLNKDEIYIAVLNGEVKDNYMAYAHSEKEAKERIIEGYFKNKGHTETELNKLDIYITITTLSEKKPFIVY